MKFVTYGEKSPPNSATTRVGLWRITWQWKSNSKQREKHRFIDSVETEPEQTVVNDKPTKP